MLVASGYGMIDHARSSHAAGPLLVPFRIATELEAAATTLQQGHDLIGSYADVDLRRFRGLTAARQADSEFCLEMMSGGAFYSAAGPGGVPAPGRC